MKPRLTIDLKAAKNYPTTVYATDHFVFSFGKLKNTDCNVLHYHNCYELEILLEGEIENIINSSKYNCTTGDYWLVFPNNFHRVEIKSERIVILSIKFTEKIILPEIILKLQKCMSCIVSKFSEEELETVTEDFDRAFVTVTTLKNEFYKDIIIKCMLSQILARILDKDAFDNNQTGNEQSFPDALYESIKYVKDNFTQKLSRDEIAGKFGFSCSYYSTIFKKCTGKSFTDFVLGEKLDYAYYLLLSTDMTIKEIAEDSGFESPAYFSKAFKRAYGHSPLNVRSQSNS